MKNSRLGLQVIGVAEPCEKAWNEMGGNNQARFCQHCQKHVHDLSAMNLAEAERLVCQAGGSMCIRYEQAPDGRVVTLDYKEAPPVRRWFWPSTFAAAVASLAAAAGVWTSLPRPAPPARHIMMGVMMMPRPTPISQPSPNCGSNQPAQLDNTAD